jgi:glutamate dehydrogenase
MSRSTDAVVQKLVEDAAALASAEASPADRAAIVAFVRGFYRNVPPAELLPRAAAGLAEAAQAMWAFVAARTPHEAKIEAHATAPGRGVVQLLNDDRRFLVDSVAAALSGLGFEIDLMIHPVMRVRRDAAGRLLDCVPDGTAGEPESMMRVEVIGDLAEDRRDAVTTRLHAVLADVRAVVEDWPRMRAQVRDIAERTARTTHPVTAVGATDPAEDAAFVAWLDSNNFLFLGTREYVFHGTELDIVPGVGLGLLRRDDVQVFDGLRAITRASPDVQAFLRTPQLTMISKSTRRSTVHRPAPMDTIIVKTMDDAGAVNGLRLILGLFTRDAYARLPAEVPVLRQKVRRCHERSGFAPDSRDGRALQHILDTFPRDELFQIDETQLFEWRCSSCAIRSSGS